MGAVSVSDYRPGFAGPEQSSRTAASHLTLDLGARIAAATAEASQRFNMPTRWITAVMRAESGFNPQVTSSAGAIGLMQIMPQTWADLRAQYGLGTDPFDIHDNIIAGAAYLRQMRDRFGPLGMLAAYNAGPERYADYRTGARVLPATTEAYVANIVDHIDLGSDAQITHPSRMMAVDWRAAPLFAGQTSSRPPDGRPTAGGPIDGSSNGSSRSRPVAFALHSKGLFVAVSDRASEP